MIYIYIYIYDLYMIYMRCRVCLNFSSRMAMMATLDCDQEQLIAPDTSQGWKAWKALHKGGFTATNLIERPLQCGFFGYLNIS